MVRLDGRYLFGGFIALALMTEFVHIEMLGGYLRPYHFVAPVIILILLSRVWRLLVTPLFLLLAGILLINLLAALLADKPSNALASFALLLANASVAVATALILMSGRVSRSQVVSIFLFVAIVSILWSAIQLAAFKFTGVNLALSETQMGQVSSGFAPGLRTEANTFAKFLNVAFLLTLPTVLRLFGAKKVLLVMLLFAAGFMISFTRSVLYTLPITLTLIYVWYQFTGMGAALSRKSMITIGAFGVGALMFVGAAASFNAYATLKIARFFEIGEILGGESSSLRLLWQQAVIDAFIQSEKTLLIGNGWGQIYITLGDMEFQAGGAEIIVFLAYGGIMSGIFYLAMQITAIRAGTRMARLSWDLGERLYYQGLAFSCLGLMLTGVLSGSVIAPEYWVVYGLAIHASYEGMCLFRKSRVKPVMKIGVRNQTREVQPW